MPDLGVLAVPGGRVPSLSLLCIVRVAVQVIVQVAESRRCFASGREPKGRIRGAIDDYKGVWRSCGVG